jgi:hypothetical protein
VAALRPFFTGLRLALHRWPVLLAMWLTALLAALPFAFLPGEALLDLAQRPVIAQMADGTDAWQWLDLLSVVSSASTGSPNAGLPASVDQALLGMGAIAFGLFPVSGLVSAFLYGGVLLAYSGSAQPWGWRRFWYGCTRWFPAFTLLALVQVLASIILLMPILGGALSLGTTLGAWGWPVSIATALLLVAWLALFEQARVFAVRLDSRNPFRALGEALTALVRRPLPWLALYGLSLLGLAVLHALFRLALLPAIDPFWPLALGLQQVFIAARLLLRASRLAGGMGLAEASPL